MTVMQCTELQMWVPGLNSLVASTQEFTAPRNKMLFSQR